MSKVRQIDYKTPRRLRSLNGKRVVQTNGRETRYQFEGTLVEGEADASTAIGDFRKDWLKSAFPIPWNDDPELVEDLYPQ
jgi:hypothetical protein